MIKYIRYFLLTTKFFLLGFNLNSLRLLTNFRRMLKYVFENTFVFNAMSNNRSLRQKNIWEFKKLKKDTLDITLGNMAKGNSWFHGVTSYAVDIISLCAACRIYKPKRIFEIGTYIGYSTYHFALNIEEDGKIFTLDLPKESKDNTKLNIHFTTKLFIDRKNKFEQYDFDKLQNKENVVQLFGDSATFDFRQFYNSIDLFFIDGAHSYEYVKNDTEVALKCCKKGGLILWHDYGRIGFNGVAKFLVEFSIDKEIYVVPGGTLAYMEVE